MKLLFLAAILLAPVLCAQSPVSIPAPPEPRRRIDSPSETLADNYQVTLTITDKEAPPIEIAVVVASTRFTASLAEQSLSFSGTLTVQESGVFVTYVLGWDTAVPAGKDTVQLRSSSAQGSVRLKLSEEIQIIRAGPRAAVLSVRKLEPAVSKAP